MKPLILALKKKFFSLMNQDLARIRPLAEPVYDEKFLGEVKMSTTEYLDVFEERRQALTTKSPSEIELCKRPIQKLDMDGLKKVSGLKLK